MAVLCPACLIPSPVLGRADGIRQVQVTFGDSRASLKPSLTLFAAPPLTLSLTLTAVLALTQLLVPVHCCCHNVHSLRNTGGLALRGFVVLRGEGGVEGKGGGKGVWWGEGG